MIIVSALLGIFSLFLFFIAYLQHRQKGFIFTNAWLYASKKERENMDERIKKREYRVARNIFFVLGVLFSLLAVIIHLETLWLQNFGYILMGLLAVLLCTYAIVQYVMGASK